MEIYPANLTLELKKKRFINAYHIMHTFGANNTIINGQKKQGKMSTKTIKWKKNALEDFEEKYEFHLEQILV